MTTPPAAEELQPAPPPRRRDKRLPLRSTLLVYLALLPALGGVLTFILYPSATAIFYSFFTWRPGFESTFTGLDNYARMLQDSVWWGSFANLGIVFVVGIGTWIVPFTAAELLISVRHPRTRYILRTLLIAPIAFPQVVTLMIWAFLYDPQQGVFNTLLRTIGLESLTQNWLGNPDLALWALLLIGFPWIAGIPFLIFTTALQNIPGEVFDAAALDGVGRLRRVFAIDLPMMASQLALLAFLAVISTLQFGMAAYILTGGGPDNATQFPILRMLAAAFDGRDWGYAAALSTTLFVVTLIFAVIVLLGRQLRVGVRRGTP